MTEHATVQAVLNAPETEMPSPNYGSSIVAHALSQALSTADSAPLPLINEKHVSEKFNDLADENNVKQESDLSPQGNELGLPAPSPSETSAPLVSPPPKPQVPPPAPLPTPSEPTKVSFWDNEIAYSSEIQPVDASSAEQQQHVQRGPATPTKAQIPTLPPSPVSIPTPRPSEARVQGTSAAFREEKATEAALARERDVAAAFAGLPQVRAHWTHNYMKILVVGEDGLGKTTFVRNLFAAYAADVDFPVADASGHGAGKIFADRPEQFCTELAVKDEDAMVWWHYLVQDTPGYGDFDGPEDADDQRSAILDYIRGCSERYLNLEMDPSRKSAMQQNPDCRVDVCLYFLPPHHVRRTDVRFIRHLSSLVPVIPILAKADSMTVEELKSYRHAVHDVLRRHKAAAGFHFSKDALQSAGAHHGPPFAVVAAGTIDRAVGRFWPVRKYPWGRCESLLTAHSELPALRHLLFETGYWELKAHTEKEYLRFRRQQCEQRAVPRPLRVLLRLAGGTAMAVAAVFLAVNLTPIVRDEVVRHETVRRVKEKVGEVVEGAMDTVKEVQGRTEEAAKVAKGVAGSAVEKSKQSARQAAAKLETPQVREAREAAERAANSPWWRFWRRG